MSENTSVKPLLSLRQSLRDMSIVITEYAPPIPSPRTVQRGTFRFIHIPYIPALHRPGWLLRYIVGPYDKLYFERYK